MKKQKAPTPIVSSAGLGIRSKLVAAGVKNLREFGYPVCDDKNIRQTIRPIPKRMPKQGDTVSLRMWTGKPYRSNQRILRTARINYVADVKITRNTLIIAGWYRCTKPNQAGHRDEQARLDGFRDWNEMRDWFEAAYGLPFRGVMIHWLNDQAHLPAPGGEVERKKDNQI